MQERISVLVVCGGKRRNNDLGTLGRHHGKRRVLEYRYDSFNHYAYGSVADWIYEQAAGIRVVEEYPGFEKVRIHPKPGTQLEWLGASIETRHGKISSRWTHTDGVIRYEIVTPVPAQIVIGKKEIKVEPGTYVFWE